jgi:uncharacterized protein YabN with tetrapyrrole methylase and pyrophosphatase domain
VGTGIKSVGHVTLEAKKLLAAADAVPYVLADPITIRWLERVNPRAESLHVFYENDKPRIQTYLEMSGRIIDLVREGLNVCAAFYGHPGVFVHPSHEAVRRAREEGFSARMLPGVSAEDCLYADLGVDPSARGCQTYEATDFLIRPRRFDTRSTLILWQIGVLGRLDFQGELYSLEGFDALVKVLQRAYGVEHEVAIYEAALYPLYDSRVDWRPLSQLSAELVSPISTLFVPPLEPPDVDRAMLQRLGIDAGFARDHAPWQPRPVGPQAPT